MNFRMARNFEHRGAMDVSFFRYVKHRFRSVVDDDYMALGIQYQDSLDHAVQNRISLVLFISDLLQSIADLRAHVVEMLFEQGNFIRTVGGEKILRIRPA